MSLTDQGKCILYYQGSKTLKRDSRPTQSTAFTLHVQRFEQCLPEYRAFNMSRVFVFPHIYIVISPYLLVS